MTTRMGARWVLLSLLATASWVAAAPLWGCTVLIAGRGTTADGSILFAKTEDDGPREVDYLWSVPRRRHVPGAVVALHSGGSIPQVEETWAYFWDQCPGTAFSNGIVNEWGVAFGSNACSSREDSVAELEARGDLVEGGLGFELRMILAERSRTAREAVELAARLIDAYGYRASGRNLNIVGPEEAWQLQMARGRHYVARRVRDDEVAIIANTFSIREVDLGDRDNFIAAPDLVDYATRRGWYDPAAGEPFDFAKAYAAEKTHLSPRNTRRQWIMAKLLDRQFAMRRDEAEQGRMPVAVKPDRKLTLRDVMTILRDHYEGTDLDDSGFTPPGRYQRSPHQTASFTICNYGTHRTTIVQQRNTLPPAIGTVVWRALDQPCSSGFVPWYLGITRVPGAFQKAPESLHTTARDLLDFHFRPLAETWRPDLDSASVLFGLLGGLVDGHYANTIGYVERRWRRFEDQAMALQPAIDRSAAELYERDPDQARELLTVFTHAQAAKSLELAREMLDTLRWHLWATGGHHQLRVAIAIDPALLDRYAGRYRLADGRILEFRQRHDQLLLFVDGEGPLEVAAESESDFFMKQEKVQFSFVVDETGRGIRVLVYHGQEEMPAERAEP